MVNPNSVIPLWLQDYNPVFYASLTDKENWTYVNALPGVLPIWVSQFTALAAALDAYQAFNRQSEVSNFIMSTYGYVSNAVTWGSGASLVPTFDALLCYSINGFMAATIARPVDYYNDMPTVAPTPPAVQESAKLKADTAAVSASIEVESAAIANRGNGPLASTQSNIFYMLFATPPVVGTFTKEYAKELYFETLHWRTVFENLNVGTLVIP